MITNTRVLVTGGAGFIGSNLIEALLAANNTVVCLDNLATGYKHNIERFFKNPNFSFIEGNICDGEVCKKAINNISVVFHHAALGSVPRSISDPVTSARVNIQGFVNIITAAKDAGVTRFIYASSSSTYGDADYSPKIETKKGNLLSPYAVTKQTNDLFASVFSQLYDIETIGLCYFNVFGPYQDPQGAYAAVIPKFIDCLLRKQSPIIYGDGSQSRDFTYIDNVVHANLLAATAPLQNKHEHINIACSESIDLTTLTMYMISSLAKHKPAIGKITPTYTNIRKGDIKHSLACIDKAKQILSYSPQVSVKDGIDKTIEWFLQHSKK
ncbi:MAG TPA: NAD-dependent epimerase/dehydratase family protein [Bacteroidales bacterium]|nr:NAD-dependent epimerase/dehydratase family protein [Bacteroidales bacterium]